MNSVEAIAEHSLEPIAEDTRLDLEQVKLVLETALLTAQEPMSLADLRKLFEQDLGAETLRRLLEDIRESWSGRGVELVSVASGWRFRTRADMQIFLDRLSPQKPPKYSRAVLETLAIIAYRQPVTRGDIEDVRGVTVSTNIVKALEVRGWIEVIGHREVPGRPALYATTRQFLDDLALRSLEDLPPLEDLGTLVDPSPPGGGEAQSELQGSLDLHDASVRREEEKPAAPQAASVPSGAAPAARAAETASDEPQTEPSNEEVVWSLEGGPVADSGAESEQPSGARQSELGSREDPEGSAARSAQAPDAELPETKSRPA